MCILKKWSIPQRSPVMIEWSGPHTDVRNSKVASKVILSNTGMDNLAPSHQDCCHRTSADFKWLGLILNAIHIACGTLII